MPRFLRSLQWCLLALTALGLAGCGGAVYVANYAANQSATTELGVSPADLSDLRNGAIDAVRRRYEALPSASLTAAQTALLCDIMLKAGDLSEAERCLDRYHQRFAATFQKDQSQALSGKRALIALAANDPARARSLTALGSDDGSRYVMALASIRVGAREDAEPIARRFALQFKPKTLYYGASLYAALGDCPKALGLLTDPERRLLRDYGLDSTREMAPFRLDIFDEFSFGWFNDFSYSPRANIYVEYLAARCLLQTGDLAQAKERFDKILRFPALAAYRDLHWRALQDRAAIAQREGDAAAAIRSLEQAIVIIETIRASISSEVGRIGFFGDKQAVYADLVTLLLARGAYKDAFGIVERARSRALVDLLASQRKFAPPEVDSNQAEALVEDLRQAEADLHVAAASDAQDAEQRSARVVRARADIARQSPNLAALVAAPVIPVESVLAKLGKDESVVAFYRAGPDWRAFLIRQGDVRAYRIPPGVERLAIGLRESITRPDRDDYLTYANELYDLLFSQFEAEIKNTPLLILPFGILNSTPFSALTRDGRFLIQDHSIRVLTNMNLLTLVANRSISIENGLVIGNPARADQIPLKGAEEEAGVVARLGPKSTLLTRSDATLQRFRDHASTAKFMHIASHGEFDRTRALASRLLLTPAPGDDGNLTVESIYRLRLSASMVVMSACETGVNADAGGGDLIGLTRGFLFAGASNVIASLWQINDAATNFLMVQFYRALMAGESAPAALRRAQMETAKKHPHPFYWSAFTLTGVDH